MWHALRLTFAEAIFPGHPGEGGDAVVPPAAYPWNGRVWPVVSRGYGVVVGGNWNGSGTHETPTVPLSLVGFPAALAPVGGLVYYFDANLSTVVPMAVHTTVEALDTAAQPQQQKRHLASGGEATVTVRLQIPPAFGAVLIPTVRAPGLVVAAGLEPGLPGPAWPGLSPANIPRARHWALSGQAGSCVTVQFQAFAPWRTTAGQRQQQQGGRFLVNISAPGLLLNGTRTRLQNVVLPVTVSFSRLLASEERAPLLRNMGSRYVLVTGPDVLPFKRWVVVSAASATNEAAGGGGGSGSSGY